MFITTFEMEDQRGIIKEEWGKTIDIVLFIDAKQDGGRKDIFFWFSAYYSQVQMFDVAISLVVELVLSACYILPPSFSPASFCLGLPLDLFPSSFSSITVFNSDSPLRVCPIHFFCLVFIVRMRDLSSPIVSNISSFVL